MKVTALHLWSIFTPKSGANAKKREGRMHFGVAQRFAALIAGVRQMSLKLSAKAAAGLPRRVKGIRICGAGWSRNVGGIVLCTERRAFICFRRAGAHRGACSFVARDGLGTWGGSCYVPRAVRSFAFGELVHIEALVFCVRAPRVHSLSGSWRTSRRLRFASKQRACRSSGQWQTTA